MAAVESETLTDGDGIMGSCMGNVGHLMQQWTLCELLTVARGHFAGLNYIDAYAMPPWATQRTRPNHEFDRVRDGLPGQGSAYQLAWHRITNLRQTEGYPSSAAFVHALWNGPHSLLLCEKDPNIAAEVNRWMVEVGRDPNVNVNEQFNGAYAGDWRCRFADGLPDPRDVCLPEDSLTLVSFDPYKYDRSSGEDGEEGDLYPEDIVRVLEALKDVTSDILLQISTYRTAPRDLNAQEAVIRSVNAILSLHGFNNVAIVSENERMMSLVYAHHVEWGNQIYRLREGYDEWRRPWR